MNRKYTILACSLVLALSQSAWAEQGGAQDPYEGYNRFMFRVNDTLDQYVMTPVARGYRKVTPSPVRTGVRNFFNNLRDVVSLGSNLLRLDIEKASTDFVRVGLNSTFGLGGLIDIAGYGQVPDNKNTLGDTFASWGWKNSHYFVYPLTGPSTVRDSIGNTISYAMPVQNAVLKESGARWGAMGLNAVQQREGVLDLTDSLDEAALDKYAYVRDVYMSMRNKQVGAAAADSGDDDIDIDSLVPSDSNDDGAQADMPADTESATPDVVGVAPEAGDASTVPEKTASPQPSNTAAVTNHHGWTEEVIGHSEPAAEPIDGGDNGQ